MTRVLVLGALSAMTILSAGAAQASPLDAAFGNTILSTYPDGRTGELWLKPDGTYDAEGRKGDPSSGKWSTRGDDKLCLKQSEPKSIKNLVTGCVSVPANGLRDGWTMKSVTGEPIKVKLVQGHAKGHQGPG